MGLEVYLGDWNEYHALLAICAGMIAHAATVLRRIRQVLYLIVLVVVCVVPAWFMSEPEDRAFTLPLAWALLFCVSFSVAFRKAILPVVTAAGVLHYLLLSYYALYLSARAAGAHLPTSILVVGLAPGAVLAIGSVGGLLSRGWFRVWAYAGYLVSIPLLILLQDPSELLRTSYEEHGFSLQLYVAAFLFGGIVLAVVSHLVQLMMLIPPRERPAMRLILDRILGPCEPHREQARLLARRHLGGRMDLIAVILLAAHALLLVYNAGASVIPNSLLIQGSIVVLAWGLMPWEAARRMRDAPPVTAP